MPVYLILGLASAVGYAFGNLFNKQAMEEGCSPILITPVIVVIQVLVCIPFFFMDGSWPELKYWYQPVITAMLWHAGGILHARALRVSDASIIAPIMGTKPVVNALLLVVLLGVPVPYTTWIAAGLVAVALFIVRTPNVSGNASFTKSLLMTVIALITFALSDTSIQHYAPRWGAFHYTAMIYAFGLLMALAALPVLIPRYKKMNRRGGVFLLLSAVGFAIPGICLVIGIGRYGHAAEINIMYSLRTILTIVLVWTGGRLVGNIEHTGGRRIFIRRLVGALILMSAIGLILFTAK